MVETPLKIVELSLIGNSELIVYRKVDVCLTVPASSAFHIFMCVAIRGQSNNSINEAAFGS